MNDHDQLDRLLKALRSQPAEPRLASIEPHVWQRVAARTAPPSWARQLRWQGTAAALALSLGAVFGGAAAARSGEPREMAVFSTSTALAPSTILVGGR
jgi:hypothetical protein